MLMSEMMIIIIGFYMLYYCDFKNYYLGYVYVFYCKDFFVLFSYMCFLEVMFCIIVFMCVYFSLFKGKFIGIEFIDLMSLKVCYNICIFRYKIFDGIV